jgi:O-antigen/teichoic acid export membrane protein
MVDRYMIIHYSGTDADTALAMVGQYHTARLVPMLLLLFSSLLGTVLVPHLTHDWELGRMSAVSRRLNMSIKMLGLSLSTIGVCVALAAPLGFHLFFGDKYEGGLAVLPLTMSFCIWCALGCIARAYLWCDEKASLASVSYCVGLVVTIALSLPLLPRYGLPGGVWATAVGNLVAVLLILGFGWWRGYAIDRGVMLIVGVPLGLCFGAWTGLAALGVGVLLVLATSTILDPAEKRELTALLHSYWLRARRMVRRTAAA